jgi:DNA-binding LacI/PurR family transcriptional regulator
MPDGHGADLIGGVGLGELVLQGTGTRTDRVLQRANHNRVPTVLLQEGGDPGLPVLRLPDEQAAILTTEHLI